LPLDLPAQASEWLAFMQNRLDALTAVPDEAAPLPASVHSTESSLREKIIEHLFVGDLLRCLWLKGIRDIEVLRSEVDRSGYDLVLESNGVVRHIQLKASYRLAKTATLNIHLNLQSKPAACVIWIRFDSKTMQLGPYLWFGSGPQQRLPTLGDTISRHTKGDSKGYKAERPNHRVVKKARFEVLATIDEVAERLFGAA
jgi:hypothetical protein